MDYLVFISICIVTTASPGPAVLTAMKNGSHYGYNKALIGIFGNIVAMLVLCFISAAGLGAIILSSAVAFTVIKMLGGGYLIYLGIKAWRKEPMALKNNKLSQDAKVENGALFKESFVVGISNPKAIAFYTALFPQFVDPNSPVIPQLLILASIFVFFSFSFLSLYAAMSAKMSGLLNQVKIQQWFNRITGGLFVSFGLVLATSSRT
jgi:threonine/homoserine/homoserine lactone efflux protein